MRGPGERMAGDAPKDYLLAGGAAELERLQLQAKVWEPEAEGLLDRIAVPPGWRVADLGCGAMGILGPLSRRVGRGGRVVGVDLDAKQLAAARAYATSASLSNLEILEGDASRTGLPAESFDLVHSRFLLAPAGRAEEFLSEMLRLVRPGGIVALEEPYSTPWSVYPASPAWSSLKDAILDAFRLGGGDFDAGLRVYSLLRDRGLEDVRLRSAVLVLDHGHPYMRLPIQFAASLRNRILEGGLLSSQTLDEAIAGCERAIQAPDAFVVSFVLIQAWGRKPSRPS